MPEGEVDKKCNRKMKANQGKHQACPYAPQPASHHHNFGNQGLTHPQKQALEKIILNCGFVTQALGCMSAPNPALLRAALQAPQNFKHSLPKESSYPIIWDSGASMSISPSRNDFVGPIKPVPFGARVQSLTNGLSVKGQGHVMWAVHDTNGMLRMLKVPAYWIPQAKVRLLSITSLLQTYGKEKIVCESHCLKLTGDPSDPTKGAVVANIDPTNNLPTTIAYQYSAPAQAAKALSSTITEVHRSNYNLSEPEKELLRWHQRLGHLSMKRVQFLMRIGVLSSSGATRQLHTAACKIKHPPKCAACQFGKQTRRSTPGNHTSSAVRDQVSALKEGDLQPGRKISVDHFVCSTHGRLFTSRGKTPDHEMYTGGALFIDHASNFVDVQFQRHLNSHETRDSKERFELMCREFGVIPVEYLSDNGSSFTSRDFTEMLATFHQIIRFAGAGAHHQNGNAERAIRTIMSIARTMMLHSAIHWPEVADAALWPMAVQHAVYLHNHVPDPVTGLAPIDVFSRTRWPQKRLLDLHVWGCPVYVLDKSLADGKKIPRWKPRSQRMVNMGHSPKHASTVPLVLNPATGAISAQFNVVFDDYFSTVAAGTDQLPDFNSPEWSNMFGSSTFQYPYDAEDLAAMDGSDSSPSSIDVFRFQDVEAADILRPKSALPVSPPPFEPVSEDARSPVDVDPPAVSPSSPMSSLREPLSASDSAVPSSSLPGAPMSLSRELSAASPESVQREGMDQTNSVHPQSPTPSPVLHQPPAIPATPQLPTSSPSAKPSNSPMPSTSSMPNSSTPAAPTPQPTRRSMRSTRGVPPNRLTIQSFTSNLAWIPPPTFFGTLFTSIGFPHPASFKATASDPDTLTFDEAMADPDRPKWLEASEKEIRSLEEKGTWVEVGIDEATSKILPGTWVFRRKRSPDGVIKKYKARYCVRGDLQEGEFSTFAPVVSWPTVRLFLVMALSLGWETCSIDFSNAFVQAKLDQPVWIHLPRGFRATGNQRMCLRLIKSLYGLTVAPRLWYQHLFTALKHLGFKTSSIDPCLLYKSNIMIVCYVDDAGIAASNVRLIDELIKNLTDLGFELTREGSFAEFLGIKFTQDPATKAITLTQKGLIKKIVEATNMVNCSPNWLPTSQVGLGSDPDGQPMHEAWSYASIVGMLLYLTTNTRPDIAFAVSQVARFNHAPKQSHATAVKMIVRYLVRTADYGMTFNPTGCLDIECFVDADFAGLYRSEPDASPNSVRSRTGYIIKLGNCPLLWKSQLQSKIALSTLEAEYSALSHCMRTLLPLRSLLIELANGLSLSADITSSIKCTVFEDNSGALLLATNQKISARTKHFLVDWHFFWQAVNDQEVTVVKIDTKDQQADFLTKGLARELFESNRKSVQGW
jgi:hypothetical protein